MKELERPGKALIYLSNHLCYLQDNNIIPKKFNIKVNNDKEIQEQMKDFEPTKEEIDLAMKTLKGSKFFIKN